MQKPLPRQLMRLWNLWNKTGDVDRIYLPHLRNMRNFIADMRECQYMWYLVDDSNDINFICWGNPLSDHPKEKTIELGLWWSSTSRTNIKTLFFILSLLCNNGCQVFARTWQEDKVRLFAKCGFKICGAIPKTSGIEMLYLLVADKVSLSEGKLAELALK